MQAARDYRCPLRNLQVLRLVQPGGNSYLSSLNSPCCMHFTAPSCSQCQISTSAFFPTKDAFVFLSNSPSENIPNHFRQRGLKPRTLYIRSRHSKQHRVP